MPQSELLFVAAALFVGLWAVIQVVHSLRPGWLRQFIVDGRKLVLMLGILCAVVATVIRVINEYNIH